MSVSWLVANKHGNYVAMRSVHTLCLRLGFGIALTVVAIGPLSAQSEPASSNPNPQLRLIVGFPSNVRMDFAPKLKNPGVVVVKANITVINESRSDETLTAINECHSHTWTVTDNSSQTGQDGSICNMLFKPVFRKIRAGEKITAQEDVALSEANYRSRGSYTLHYRFWGVSGNVNFTTTAIR